MWFFNKEFAYYCSLLGYLGFLIIGNIGVYIFIYKFIERVFNYESNIIFIVFVVIGVISGFYNAYKVIMKK